MKTFLNILPPERKENLRLAKWYRELIRQEMGFLFLGLFLIGLLLGVGFLLRLDEDIILQRNVQEEKENKAYAEIVSYGELFTRTQEKIPIVEKLLQDQKGVLWLFHFMEENMSDGISLVSISFEDVLLQVSGRADTRDHLLMFQEKFQKSECFSDVSLPLSQLAKKEEIDFEISASINARCF